ncbi:unnamed protein product [Blepharisma stoltei]|uniref:Uncharacterized protein n=1 Tax=Blepharisma stoltei TaxID=1481888 RepID=A0AAU9JQ91_9CILI|nr:unnamed protein product [Blepharisma stoltei]
MASLIIVDINKFIHKKDLMIGDRVEISVLNVDLPDKDKSQLSCYISIDKQTYGAITPINSGNDKTTVKLWKDRLIKFSVVKIETEEELGSVTLSGSILPEEGFQWLPLFNEKDKEILSIPTKVNAPRLFIALSTLKGLNPIYESTENSETVSQNDSLSESENEFMPELKLIQSSSTPSPEHLKESFLETQFVQLANENFALKQEIERIKKNNSSVIMSLNYEIEELRKKEKKALGINKILQKELGEINEKHKSETLEKEKIIKELKENLEKAKNDAKAKENSILMILENKDKVIYKKQCEINNLKKSISLMEEKTGSNKEADILKMQINELKQKLNEVGIKTENEDLHLALEKHLIERNAPGFFKLVHSNKYASGSNIFTLLLKNGKIFCEIDGIEISIDEIINSRLKANLNLSGKVESFSIPIKGKTNSISYYNTDEADTENTTDGVQSRSSFGSERTLSSSPELLTTKSAKRVVKVSSFMKSSMSSLREIAQKVPKSIKKPSFNKTFL